MGPARSVSFIILPSAAFNGCRTVSVFCQMWSKLIPNSATKNSIFMFVEETKSCVRACKTHRSNARTVQPFASVLLSGQKSPAAYKYVYSACVQLQEFVCPSELIWLMFYMIFWYSALCRSVHVWVHNKKKLY